MSKLRSNLEKLRAKDNHGELTLVDRFWLAIAELTGVMETHCRRYHHRYQTLSQVQYDGTSVVFCSKCHRTYLRK